MASRNVQNANASFMWKGTREIGTTNRPDLEFTKIDTSERVNFDVDKVFAAKGKEYKDLANYMVSPYSLAASCKLLSFGAFLKCQRCAYTLTILCNRSHNGCCYILGYHQTQGRYRRSASRSQVRRDTGKDFLGTGVCGMPV